MKLQELREATDAKQEIAAWLDENRVEKYTINDDLSVDVEDDVNLMDHTLQSIPVQFDRVTGDFDCSENVLKSLQGAPRIVGGSFYCDFNNLESLQGAPREISGSFRCNRNQIKSLEGISRIIRTVDGTMYIPGAITSHVLGLARIRGLRRAVISDLLETHTKRLEQAIDIINNSLGGRGNIHQAQEQLLDAGLQEFAQL